MFSSWLVAAWKRANRGVTDPPGPSRTYALPIRFVWLLMGLIYFFPGFWNAQASSTGFNSLLGAIPSILDLGDQIFSASKMGEGSKPQARHSKVGITL